MELVAPPHVRVFEIGRAADWAHLCTRFPLDVTAHKRHDWYRITGHTGRWLVPDWLRVAEHYDAVHLQVGAYLVAAGAAIPVADHSGAASVIAGWNPDETFWFTPDITHGNDVNHWTLNDNDSALVWRRATST